MFKKLSAVVGTAALLSSVVVTAAFAGTETLTLGMAYVVPAHQPGAKVRTPEGMAPLLADWLTKRSLVSEIPVTTERVVLTAEGEAAASQGEVDAFLLSLPADTPKDRVGSVIPTGYRAGMMAIMRTDTDIHHWEDLRGRTVCLTQESGLAGSLEERYGAIEKVFRAPADALLDLRIGGCDATVHDSAMLEALLEFPEWKKFSARLPIQDERELLFIVPEHSSRFAQALGDQVRQWQESRLLNELTQQAARDIAFEVYMDQEVPDCH